MRLVKAKEFDKEILPTIHFAANPILLHHV